MEQLAREARLYAPYPSNSSVAVASSSSRPAFRPLNGARSSPKKPKLNKRDKRRARSASLTAGVKVERPDEGEDEGVVGRPVQAGVPQFRRIQPLPLSTSTSSTMVPTGSPRRPPQGTRRRNKTPLFLPEDDRLAEEILARSRAREEARLSGREMEDEGGEDDEEEEERERGEPRGFEALFGRHAVSSPSTTTTSRPNGSPEKGKGKKRALPQPVDDGPTEDDDDPEEEGDAGGRPTKITRRRESYQTKTVSVWMREHALTLEEANARWDRFLKGRNGSKGETYRLACVQRENLLVRGWMRDDGLKEGEARERLERLVEREERERREKGRQVRAAAATLAAGGSSPSAPQPVKKRKSRKQVAPTTTSPVKPTRTPTSLAQASGAPRRFPSAVPSLVPLPPSPVAPAPPPPALPPPPAPATSTSQTARAIDLLCSTERARTADERLTIVDLFVSEGRNVEVFLALPEGEMRSAWVERRLRG